MHVTTKAPKNMKLKLTEVEQELEIQQWKLQTSTLYFQYEQTRELNKEREVLNTINQLELTDISSVLHPTIAEHTLFSVHVNILQDKPHIRT